jgi:predicted dehydrogenase
MAESVRVGILGAGFSANLHANAYRRIRDIDVEIVAVAALPQESAEAFAHKHGIPFACGDAGEVIGRKDLNLVDLCVPNHLHEEFVSAAAQAGKHIICEKPLTGYFGGKEASVPVGATPRKIMLSEALASADRIIRAAADNNVRLMYAENWLYSPAVEKASRLAEASGGTILEIRAQECHSGSHASYAKSWARSGGGALIRLAPHPIGVALWLKQQEGLRRDGMPIGVESVLADVGDLSKVGSFQGEGTRYLVDDWEDVENWSVVIISFTDGTRALIQASDTVLGGMEDTLQLFLSNCRIDCDMTHSGLVRAFAPNAQVFGEEYIMEKLSTKAGWSYPSIDEEYLLGYPQEIRDFVECVAFCRDPRCGGTLGLQVVQVIYAAYQSAEEGRRISLD